MKAISWSKLIFVWVCLVCIQRSLGQGPGLTLPSIQMEMKKLEDQWRCTTTEVLRLRLQPEGEEVQSSASYSLDLRDGYRWHELKRSALGEKTDPKISQTPMETVLHEFDGRTSLTIYPRKLVEMQRGYQPSPRPSQPFAPVLHELGFQGSMSEFLEKALSSTDARLMDMSIEVQAAEQGQVRIERKAKLRNGETWQVQRIVLDTQTMLPISGEAFSLNAITHEVNFPIKIVVRPQALDETQFNYDMIVDGASTSLLDERSYVRVRIQRVPREASVSVYRVRELAENPTIRTYSQNVLISTKPHIARPPKAKKSTPPLEKWLFVNNLVFGAVASYFAIKISIGRWRRQASSFSTKVSE